ncbi:hypothetical protein CEP54_012729 [Fusarium duplospermum]|uniref:Uncharacterized protein n=1 Tax=Fusarium duplospermum TaxID=1325734 RepID=A0A428P712_9HYPO|nr:hypothetical protein CEP54_012729 [Fusarium duplospermum]
MAPGRKFIRLSFDWYESTIGDSIEPVEEEEKPVAKVEKTVATKGGKKVAEKAEEKVEEEVTIYITGQTTNMRFRYFWAITIYDGSTQEFRSYEVRKAFNHTPCTLKSSKGHPGGVGVQYITMGKVSCGRAQELMDLLEIIPVTQSKSAAYANRQYINDVARFLVAGDFSERQQVEDEDKKVENERQKAAATREKARAQAKNDRQSQNKANKAKKGHSSGNGAFPAWFLDGSN